MTEKEYNAAMSRLNDRYLMESTMTNEDYLILKRNFYNMPVHC